jgi:lipocalin
MVEYVEGDYAIVQAPDFSTLYILSRVQNVTDDKLEVGLAESNPSK